MYLTFEDALAAFTKAGKAKDAAAMTAAAATFADTPRPTWPSTPDDAPGPGLRRRSSVSPCWPPPASERLAATRRGEP